MFMLFSATRMQECSYDAGMYQNEIAYAKNVEQLNSKQLLCL